LLEVHDEVAAHIQNALEDVQYIDGVSSSGDESEAEDKPTLEAGLHLIGVNKKIISKKSRVQIRLFY
jgi:hypothetical protein